MDKKEGINIWWLIFISAILAISMMFYSPIYGLLLLDLMSFSGFSVCAIQIILCIYKLANRSKWQKCTGIVVDKKILKHVSRGMSRTIEYPVISYTYNGEKQQYVSKGRESKVSKGSTRTIHITPYGKPFSKIEMVKCIQLQTVFLVFFLFLVFVWSVGILRCDLVAAEGVVHDSILTLIKTIRDSII